MRPFNSYVGQPIERLEDLRFLRGRGEYVDDLHRADVLHAADQWAVEPATVDEVLDAQRWARDRARGAVSREVVTTK